MKSRYVIVFFCFFVLSACGQSENDKIEVLLSGREKAFETKDVGLYMSLIAPNYRQVKDDREILQEDVKKLFLMNVTMFESLSLKSTNRSIYVDGSKANVAQKTMVDALLEDERSRFKLIERIELEKIDGKWVIVKEPDSDFLTKFVFSGSRN